MLCGYQPTTRPDSAWGSNVRDVTANILVSHSVDHTGPGQGPDAEDDVADDLLAVDTADGGVAGVNGDFAVVAHDEDLALGNLIRELDVGLAVGLGSVEVELLDALLVHKDVALLVDVHPFAAVGDDALDQDIVVVVKGHDLAGIHPAALDGEDDVPVVEGAVHGLAVDVEDGQKEDSDQDSNRRDRDEAEDGVAHSREEAAAVVLLFQLCLELGAGGEGDWLRRRRRKCTGSLRFFLPCLE